MDCGPTCLRMVAKYFGRHYTAQTLRERAQISRDGVSMLGITEAIGFKTVGVKITLEKLVNEMPLPCILHWGQNHFVVLYKISNPTALSRRFLAGLWGGRKPNTVMQYLKPMLADAENFNGNTSTTSFSDNRRIKENELTDTRTATFHIADPGRGLVPYTSEEFQRKRLSTQIHDTKEGIALTLESTLKFYEEEEEKSQVQSFAQILNYLWKYKKLFVQLALGMLAGSGFSLILPFLTQSVVDVGINTQNLSFVYLVLIAQIVLLLSTATIDFLRSWILLHISTRLNLSILSSFLSKLMRLPFSFFDLKQFGDIMQRICDHHRIEAFLTGQALNTIFSLFNLIIFGFILAYYHLTIFGVAMGSSVLYVIWVIAFLKQRRKLDTKRFEVSSDNQSQIVQLIQGMLDIKLSGAETSKRWEWERTQAKLFKWSVRSLSLSQFQQVGALFINNGKNIFISFLAAKAVIDGQLTLGAMMSVQYILGQFNAPVEGMIGFLQSWQDAQISLEHLNEVHKLKDEEPFDVPMRAEWDNGQDIVINDLCFTYRGAGNEPVLKDINLTIPFCKTTAIVGTSGRRKTTLLKLLLRFYDSQKGRIYLTPSHNGVSAHKSSVPYSTIFQPNKAEDSSRTGLDIKMISHKAWRQQCGVVMQEGFLFSDTIARNIAVCEEVIDQEKLFRAAHTANIHSFIESLPLGYHTKIGAEGNGISQGQKQRILIARSVYKDPRVLLFDEATNAA